MRNVIFIFLLLFGLNSCKNELEINAPWIETPVVYGFLDAYKDTQYIRIQKTYQNSVNQTTKEGAQIADSLYFDTTLQVKVYSNFNEVNYFTRVPIPKTPGVFAADNHYVYRCIGFKPGASGLSKQYWLSIYNPVSGKDYTSQSVVLVDSARFGTSSNNVMYITDPDPNGNIGYVFYNVKVSSSASIYDLFIRFNYTEYYTDGSSAAKYMDYFIQKNIQFSKSVSNYSINIKGRDYIDYLKKNITYQTNVSYRKYGDMVYYASGGSSDLAYVTDLSQPSTSIVPKNTQYSNITGALGIFSSLSIHSIYPFLPPGNAVKKTIDAEVPQFVP